MKRLAIAVFAFLSLPVNAQVYKCKDGATTVFSSQPCAADAKPISVRPAAGSAVAAQAPAPAGADAQRSIVQRGNDAANRRILDDEIYRKTRSLTALQEEAEAAQESLRDKKRRAANNLAGATWEKSISEEMSATALSYQTRIQAAQRELDDLKSRRAKIQPD